MMNTDVNTLALAAVIRAIREHNPEMAMTIKRELEGVRDLQGRPRAEWVNSDPYGPLIAASEGR